MAEVQAVNEAAKAPVKQEESPKKKSKGLISRLGVFKIPILFMLVSVLAVTTALVITRVTQTDAATKSESHTKETKKKELGKFVPLDSFTVNLAGGQNYLQTTIVFEIDSRNAELENELKERKPQISDVVIAKLTSKSIEDISDNAGRERLKAEIKKAVDSLLGYGKIERVYFTTFIMQ
ncbi:MAG: flagellar basal body-associated FliL family protein [Actinomycetota bacterium]|nr:flagellar basal body-associated FliL family protein [Actinomycetota bacterium]